MNKRNNVYSYCVELSKIGNEESLRNLLKIYMTSEKKIRKTAKQALRKTKSKKLVVELLEEELESQKDINVIYLLLCLGISIERSKYIKRYLRCLKGQNIDLQSVGFYKEVRVNPLTDIERDEITQYIIESKDFNLRLLSLVGEENTERVLDELLNYISLYGVNEDIIKIFESSCDYLELIQEEIYEAVIHSLETNLQLMRYLDFSIKKNIELLDQYKEIELVYKILSSNCLIDKLISADNFNIEISLKIIRKQQISAEDWTIIKEMIDHKARKIDDISEHTDFINFLMALAYFDIGYVEKTLIELYEKTKLYSDYALLKLASIKSQYAYREMISFMLTSGDRKERYKYAVKLMMAYPKNGSSIYAYAAELNDDRLMKTLDEVAEKFNIQTSFSDKYEKLFGQKHNNVQLLPNDTIISEFLFDLAQEINAELFFAAVGFTFSSGLKMLLPLLNYVKEREGKIEIITGSLQNFESSGKNIKIDKNTVHVLNNLIQEYDLKLFTYTESFYHGKFFCVANKEKAYVIIGSTNISKTAFLGNYELNTLITIDLLTGDNQIVNWYKNFRNSCIPIMHLNEEEYENLRWDCEADVYTAKVMKKISNAEMNNKIQELSDEETQFRLNSWMKHEPTDIYSELGIASLQDYIVFLFAEKGLAVFESFIPGNAYYTFRYFDLDELLKKVSTLSKTQMILSSNFVSRGYHISDKNKLKNKIDMLFAL